jgi:hypothetical protein
VRNVEVAPAWRRPTYFYFIRIIISKPNTIVRFDPATEKFQSWAIPGGGDIVRNMDVNRDGNPVMANSLVNQIGIVEVNGATN